MCGIAGVLDDSAPVDQALIERMCAALEHRGPDSRGVHLEDGVGLGAQRLAVIDVAGGAQPMSNETGEVVVVFNGEIYNHHELRRDLVRRGHRFASAADTEVIAHLYEERGERLVEDLRGMFAFAVWDRPRRRLVCARDRAGEKPLFWTRRGGRFAFASELRALLADETIERRLDPQAIEAYLGLQYVPHPLCAVAGVHKLAPASTLVVELGGTERVRRYWRLRRRPGQPRLPRAELEERLRSLLDEATRIRLESEVPLGALLSGGVDSTAVVAAMARHASGPLNTFSVGFDDPQFDETPIARRVAERFGTDHHDLRVGPEAVALLPKLARHYGEPFGDSSAIPSFKVSELASGSVTVVLTGDGGDETLGGYMRYMLPELPSGIDRLPPALRPPLARALALLGPGGDPRGPRARLARLARRLAMSPGVAYANLMAVFDGPGRRALLEPGFGDGGPPLPGEDFIAAAWEEVDSAERVDRMLDTDAVTYLPGALLPKIDVATMAHGLEARAPFLDHVWMEFAASLPPELRVGPAGGKEILRSALRGEVPDEVLDRPKMGFEIPLGRWLREDLADLPADLLLDSGARTRDYLRPDAVRRLIEEHRRGPTDHSPRIWVLLALETWHREVLDA